MKKNILITSALSQELNIVKKQIKSLNINKKKLNIDFFTTGIWNYKTIINLTEFIAWKNCIWNFWWYDFIVNIWVCWYKDNKEELIQIARIKNIHTDKELLIPIAFQYAKLNSICCSENIVYDNILLADENYIDMESYWFELVCEKFNISRIILKVPVDKVWNETKDFNYKKAFEELETNIDYKKLLDNINDYINKLSKKGNLDKYYIFYNMTFSEKIIFTNLYNKYIAIKWEDFEKFFQENKEISKKELFTLLREI